MLKRSLKVLVAIVLSLMFTVSLLKLVLLIWSSYPAWLHHFTHDEIPLPTVDEWLDEHNLAAYKQLFRDKVGCTLRRSVRCCLRCTSTGCSSSACANCQPRSKPSSPGLLWHSICLFFRLLCFSLLLLRLN